MGETGRGETGSSSDGLSKSYTNFLLKGWAVFSPCYLTWGQTMMEIMKIMLTSFKRSNACTATLSAPNPAAGHCWPMPPLETPVHSQACLGQSLVVSRLLSLGPGAHNILFVVSKGLFPVLCKFWWLYGGLVVTSSKRAYAIPRSTAPRAPATAPDCMKLFNKYCFPPQFSVVDTVSSF